MGKWFAVIYDGGSESNETIYYRWGWTSRFNILMSCLKPKVGSGTILEDCPKHLPDESLFDIHNIIDVPLEVIPKGSIHFNVKYYNEIKDLSNLVKDISRNDI